MLILEAEIRFDTQKENPEALNHELYTKHILRPHINFGNNLLFSGEIFAGKDIETLTRGKSYKVMIGMPTIEQEAYEAIKELAHVGWKIYNSGCTQDHRSWNNTGLCL